ncbi:MAG: hypothetical protein JST58_09665 [Bacteroidetes bacterium]|nr:hypothetical protein [Bacteroidota bacterium]
MKKINRNYIIGISILSVFLLLTYAHHLYKPTLITRKVTLKTNPKYDFKTYKGVQYWIDLSFNEIKGNLEISGTYYQYLEHPLFLKEVKKDSVVTITYTNNFIRQLSKDGHNYMDPIASEYHWEQNAMFARILFFVALLTCLIPFLFQKIMDEDTFLTISKNFGAIIFVILVLTGLITYSFIDPKFINSDWTKYPIEKRR